MDESTDRTDPGPADQDRERSQTASPVAADAADGGPGSHNEDQSGGAENDPASGGISEAADDEANDGANDDAG